MNKASVAKGAAWTMLFSFWSRVLFPLVGIYVTGRIGVESVGVFGIAVTLFTLAELFREGGLASTYIADPKNEIADDRHYQGVSVAMGFLMSGLMAMVAMPIAFFYRLPDLKLAIWCVSGAIVLGSFTSIPGTRMVRDAKFREVGLADAAATAVGYVVALVLAVMGYGLWALLGQMLVRGVLYLAQITRLSGWIEPSFSLSTGGKLLRASFSNLASNIAYTVYTMGDYAVIGKLLGPAANGAYWVAFNLASKPYELVGAPISRTMMIALSRSKGDLTTQAHLLARTLTVLIVLTVPIYVLVGIHAHTIVAMLYPKKFAESGTALALLAFYVGARNIGSVAGSALVVSGNAVHNALSWLPGYAIAISGFLWFRGSSTLSTFVAVLSVGAVAVYTTNILVAWVKLGMTRQHLAAIMGGLATVLPASSFVAASLLLPIHPYLQFTVALVGGAIIHGLVVGKSRIGSWTGAFSKTGLRTIYDSF